ncbi:cytochrome c-type biogenesis protein CcsB [Paenibacillus phyllosphaerae]|uniref:Cytochrome c-type biogenesis protein CcsB n=1 Tax=Paenibacillus phyllosphaerae TaxID=274593 RepID=A0A7W5FLP4_9BACL|nr:c-type cytochrome biogenesis protein CcsB [Paenibacillus phyllosphaerae]MBB3109242.1 cytochrome c-type biogenesis protein CcsB [Paenibacillus phyllosphaerae]
MNSSLLTFSSDAYLVAFFLYCLGFISYGITIAGARYTKRDPKAYMKRWGRISYVISLLGFVSHVAFFFTRWIGGGHIPTSNMYEFISFLAMMIMLAFVVVHAIYRKAVIGLFTLPLIVIIVAYSMVFPQEVQPLIPALQSYWLKIHVTTAALGEAFFAVGFATALLQLLRVVDFREKSPRARRSQRWVEIVMIVGVIMIGYLVSVFGFRAAGYEAVFVQENVTITDAGVDNTETDEVVYSLPPIFKPFNSQVQEIDSFIGLKDGVFETPHWMKGVDAARKLNTIIWSIIAGLVVYAIIRLILRKPIGAVLHPFTRGIDPDDLDEISYRTIAIGYPLFTLGALVFAMIWAYEAWSRFWGWDPKEVWALITWLYYTAYLHLRLSRGWHGEKSAWLAVIGFIVVMFTLVGVNLVLVGLHSYAGV